MLLPERSFSALNPGLTMAKNFTVEDALSALIKALIDPVLARLNPHADASVGEEDISKQMEAIAWLYNHFICRDFPHLEFLNASSLCRKAIILRTRLIRYMGQTKGWPESLQNMTLTERKVRDACSASEALRNALDPKIFPVSTVCVCVLDAKQERCVLVSGCTTIGVWSFIEKTAHPWGFNIEEESKGKTRKKKNKGNHARKDADGSMQMIARVCPLELAFSAVKEQTGMEENVLQVEEELSIYQCMNQPHGSTRFFIMRCKKEANFAPIMQLERVVWVPVNEALSQAEGPLLEKTTMGLYATSAVQHFRLRPFCILIRNWFARGRSETRMSEIANNLPCEEPAARIYDATPPSLKPSMHENTIGLEPPITANKTDGLLHKTPMKVDGLGQCLSCPDALANVKSDGLQLHITESAILQPIPPQSILQMSDFTSQQNLAREVLPFTKDVASFGESGKLSSSTIFKECKAGDHFDRSVMLPAQSPVADVSICAKLSSSPVAKSFNSEETVKMVTAVPVKKKPDITVLQKDLGTKFKESTTTSSLLLEDRVQGENLLKGPIQPETENVVLKKSAISIGPRQLADSTSEHPASAGEFECFVDSTMQGAAVQVVQSKRNFLLKELIELMTKYQLHTDHLSKQITECDKEIMTLLGGGKVAQQLATKLCKDKSVKKRKIAVSDVGIQKEVSTQPFEIPLDQADVSSTYAKRRPLSRDAIYKAMNSTKELKDVCIKNMWPLPSYSVFAISNTKTENIYHGKARLRGADFELSETGEPCNSIKAAKASAAACMLSALYLIRARNGMT